MLWAGGLADRYRIRYLAVVCLILMSVFAVAIAINPFVWLLPVIIFGLRFCGQGMLFHIAMVAMSRWFTQNRGKAISISVLGFLIGEAFLPLLFVSAMGYFTWNNIWIGTALLALLIIPIVQHLLAQERTPKSDTQNLSKGVGIANKHWTRSEVLRHPLFWFVAPSIMAPSIFGTSLYFQQIHLTKDKGWAHLDFVLLFPFFTGATVLSMMVYGWAVDRFSATRLMPFFQIPMALGFLVMGFAPTLSWALVAMILIAMTQGGNAAISVAFWSEAYGTKHVGAIKALATGLIVFGSAIGPALSGVLIDHGITFSNQMPAISILICCICLITYFGLTRFGQNAPKNAIKAG